MSKAGDFVPCRPEDVGLARRLDLGRVEAGAYVVPPWVAAVLGARALSDTQSYALLLAGRSDATVRRTVLAAADTLILSDVADDLLAREPAHREHQLGLVGVVLDAWHAAVLRRCRTDNEYRLALVAARLTPETFGALALEEWPLGPDGKRRWP